MTADLACGAAWLLQVQKAPSCEWLGAQGRSHGRQGRHPKRVFDSRGYGRT
jgi:hypothetical protein